jgi:hypothetical protein
MEKFSFDVVSQTLTITAKFDKMMNDTKSDEYKLVQRFRKDFPNLTIAKKTHKSATSYTTKSGEKFNCNQFKNLTYDRMEKFISALPKNEGYLREYLFVKNFASAIQHNGYALVRKWFVAQFPEFRKNPLFYLYNTPNWSADSLSLKKKLRLPPRWQPKLSQAFNRKIF